MKVLLIRHAEAANIGQEGVRTDDERPLTPHGRATAARLAAALQARGYAFDAVLCSPLLRARQTAEPLMQLLEDGATSGICEELAPDSHDPTAVCAAIAALDARRVIVVGHLPDIAELAGYLLGSVAVEFDKGTAAFLDCGGDLKQARATLEWVVTPEWY